MAKTGPPKDHYDQQREGGQAGDLERATTGHSAAARHEHWAAVAGRMLETWRRWAITTM
jgi:hypothetical protein